MFTATRAVGRRTAPKGDTRFDGEREAMFRHACAMGLERIVSKKLTSRYKSGPVQELAEGQEPGLRAE